jgi:hypothetical protein
VTASPVDAKAVIDTDVIGEDDRAMLATLQLDTFDYFLRHADPHTGLVADSNQPGSPASITATGFSLAILCIAVERGWMSRAAAVARALTTLRFFTRSAQGPEPDATGHHGFYYHFLDMHRGHRSGRCELSTIDTAFLIAGVLAVAGYFTRDEPHERELRELADALYRRVDWRWACHRTKFLGHGWSPEDGFLEADWSEGYCEALLLYILALGSPTSPIDPAGYQRWIATFEPRTYYGQTYFYAAPLFIHQLSHVWIDFRGIRDDQNRALGCDYFDNSRRATIAHHRYAIDNPRGFAGYSANMWGLTASNGPGPGTSMIDGVEREFFGYVARGAPDGIDDGTIAPWAVVASLPFAPDVVCATVRHAIEHLELTNREAAGFEASFNPTFPETTANRHGWVAPWRLGLNEGPIVLMIENHATGLIWDVLRRSPYVVQGLRAALFRGGWLGDDA